jgi:hypothetical protein
MKMLTEDELREIIRKAYAAGHAQGCLDSSGRPAPVAWGYICDQYVDQVCPRTW